ncbi:protein phosphatase 2C 57 [Cynara cardunculus var. scolymus]|uniref:protein phosphatase 2C 57 n=1 Tax=Cynara cardunculus var. scolymus TaxID=59895 RepID=UPI000D62ADF9|nr:protein phosphatase 2C 57 [Cynara cardunculus var. scolymus]
MALWSPRMQRFLLNNNVSNFNLKKTSNNNSNIILKNWSRQGSLRCCSAIAIDAPSSLSDGLASGIRWGSAKLQGAREEMEDDAVIVASSSNNELDGFHFAAVFDGHAGFSSVKFLREELYKECVKALQGGILLSKKDLTEIEKALKEAFMNADAKLLNWLEMSGKDDESGATATTMFVGNDMLFISHVGDSCAVLSKSGKPEVLTNSHRPYGRHKVSLQEIKRVREAGGWIVDGRICGDISISRAFGDMRFKTKKNEMLEKGVEEGRWTQKFISRIRFVGDLVIATPDIYHVTMGTDAEFVLLATDGLWDYINSSDAVNFVRNQLREHGDVQVASEALAQMALDQYSQDNVTIVIADLGRTDWQNIAIQKQNFVYELIQAFATIGIVSFGIWMSSTASF